MKATPQPERRILSLFELRAERERARREYLVTARRRSRSRDTRECARLWRTFLAANATYTRATGETK